MSLISLAWICANCVCWLLFLFLSSNVLDIREELRRVNFSYLVSGNMSRIKSGKGWLWKFLVQNSVHEQPVMIVWKWFQWRFRSRPHFRSCISVLLELTKKISCPILMLQAGISFWLTRDLVEYSWTLLPFVNLTRIGTPIWKGWRCSSYPLGVSSSGTA